MTLKGPDKLKSPSGATRCVAGSAPPVGVFVDGYDLLNVIGEGGVGIVYQAVQKSIGRETAVKMIKPGVACNAREKAKFISEAMITGGLDHPNIVPIHDLGTAADGQPFYVMKMVRGTPWDRVIAERSLPENLRILLDVCDAVSFAHCKGVIHRDLKPANVMLGEFGEVQLMDWGLSLSVSEDGTVPAIARSHAAGGTPAYMAPEMVTGDDGPVGFHSDVYLLGAVLYEIATGQPPHAGERVLECLENARWNLIRPTERTGVLVDIALKAMQTSPADRYSSVQDFKQAILDYQAHAESINLCQRSAEHLARARQTRNYEAFAEALFGFREALKLWDGNREAQAGVSQTQWHYARCAFDKSDLDLAASTLDPNYPAHRELAAEVARAQRRRELAKRRLRLFRTAAVSLTAALILIWTVAYVSISAAKRQAEAAREVAVAAQQAEAGQRRLAESAKAEAEEEEKRAVQALADLEKAVKAMVEAQTQEERALAQARAAELVAAETRDELARTGMLMDNSWWVFDQEGARQRQSEAAQSLDMPAELTLTLSNDVELTLVLIPPGDFVMGSPPKEAKRGADEYLHRVTHRRPFYLGRLELTEAQWQAATGQLPRSAAGRTPDPTLPATGSSFDQITSELLPALQKYAPPGWEFRLPTEAQWEYACRAGTATAYYTGDEPDALDAAGWHLFNGDRQVQPVGGKPPNPFGLYDMHGNVGEVCADQYDSGYYLESPTDDPVNASPGERRVVRGGSVFNTREHCRTAYRSYVYRKNQYEFLGLRVALVLLDHPDGDDTP